MGALQDPLRRRAFVAVCLKPVCYARLDIPRAPSRSTSAATTKSASAGANCSRGVVAGIETSLPSRRVAARPPATRTVFSRAARRRTRLRARAEGCRRPTPGPLADALQGPMHREPERAPCRGAQRRHRRENAVAALAWPTAAAPGRRRAPKATRDAPAARAPRTAARRVKADRGSKWSGGPPRGATPPPTNPFGGPRARASA